VGIVYIYFYSIKTIACEFIIDAHLVRTLAI
jgi:hypothetical protein